MAYRSLTIPVMIASPGDVREYRTIARDVVHRWNYVHSLATEVMLTPVGWETHSSPELGATAQDLINDRVLADCDLLIGIFWTRLGTPTSNAASGTVEEIQRHIASGKPAMIYVCEAPVAPAMLDGDQYSALKGFVAWCRERGIVNTVLGTEQFQDALQDDLQIALYKNEYLRKLIASNAKPPASGLAPGVSVQDEISGISNVLSEKARQLLLEAERSQGSIIIVQGLAAGVIFRLGLISWGTQTTHAKPLDGRLRFENFRS